MVRLGVVRPGVVVLPSAVNGFICSTSSWKLTGLKLVPNVADACSSEINESSAPASAMVSPNRVTSSTFASASALRALSAFR